MDNVRAKFLCAWIEKKEDGAVRVNLQAVTSGSKENEQFWKYTPSGSMEMYITNPSAAGFFEKGKEYFLDFSRANS